VPADTELTGRPPGVQAWDELSDDQRRVGARLMETYAGFAEHTDFHTGRLIDALEEIGVLDDTIVIYIAGDNGASGEGGLDGTFNELKALNGIPKRWMRSCRISMRSGRRRHSTTIRSAGHTQ
jgi:arylsulfatase A-like enzyme